MFDLEQLTTFDFPRVVRPCSDELPVPDPGVEMVCEDIYFYIHYQRWGLFWILTWLPFHVATCTEGLFCVYSSIARTVTWGVACVYSAEYESPAPPGVGCGCDGFDGVEARVSA